jgi:hypothetical protein
MRMARISQIAEIEVRAPAEAAFSVVAEDIPAVEDEPTEAAPLRVGFRWHETVVHDRSVCRTDWIVTELREPFVLEKTMGHLCRARRREVMGGERWHFEETDTGITVVTLRAWRSWPGMRGWFGRLFTPRGHSLRKRLAYVQLRAERAAPRTA